MIKGEQGSRTKQWVIKVDAEDTFPFALDVGIPSGIKTDLGYISEARSCVAGYQSISNSEGTFAGTESIADGTYHINVAVDGGAVGDLSIVLATKTVADLPAVIQTALRADTSSTETVTLTGGKIVFTSATKSDDSAIIITEGAGDDGGLIAALTAISGVTAIIDTAVNGGAQTLLTDVLSSFNAVTGILTITAGSTAFVADDEIKVLTWFYTADS